MALERWYVPSWSGDYRLEADGKNARLVVTDPTPAEWDDLGHFLVNARKNGWVDSAVGVARTGTSSIPISTTVEKAGSALVGDGWWTRKRAGLITVVKSAGGKLEVTRSMADLEAEKPEAEKPKKAVTVRRSTLSCPDPQDGPDRRASEVLYEFSTPRQRKDWQEHGWLFCFGGFSGRRYRIVHRHHPLARKQSKIGWDMEGSWPIHAFDWSVPPAEEVLALKLALEFREDWIRNPSGAMPRGAYNPVIFTDPFMARDEQMLDGVQDSEMTKGLATALVNVLPDLL